MEIDELPPHPADSRAMSAANDAVVTTSHFTPHWYRLGTVAS
jgi:hypothetical protein